jgi:transcriptional/translational regulatory protein YebC/TACO1
MKDGREFSAHVESAKGHPFENPLTKEEIEDKYRTNVAFAKAVTREKAETALDMLNNLEEIDDITKVVQLLVVQGGDYSGGEGDTF